MPEITRRNELADLELRSQTLRPRTPIQVVREDAHWTSVACLLTGAASLVLAVIGPAIVVLTSDLADHRAIAVAMQSTAFETACLVAVGMALLTMAGAALRFKRQSTRTARRQTVGGMILALEAAAVGLAVWYFVQGDMATFTRNFVNLPQVGAWTGAFLNGMKWTLILALAATVSGIILGLVVAVFLIADTALVRAPARLYVNMIRGTPILVQLSVVYFGLALGLRVNWSPQVALVVTLALNNGAYTAEIFRAGLQSIEIGQLNAARGLGMSYMQSLRLVIIPQAVRRVIPPLMNDFINITKETSLLIFLGATLSARDLYSVASQGYSQYFNSTFYIAGALGYLVITLPLIRLVNYVEKRIRSGLVNVGG